MFGLNPYAMIGGAVAALALVATLHIQSLEIHKYHALYDCVNKGLTCPKNFKDPTVPELEAQIATMIATQSNQTVRTEERIKYVQLPPKVETKIKVMKAEPLPADCKTPAIPDELKDYM